MPPRFLLPYRYACALLLSALFAGGCLGPHREWPDDLVWSPDGKHAAVLRAGFRISDVDGNLTPQLDDRVYRAAWLDCERLLLARSRTVKTFAEIASAVGPDRAKAIAAESEHAWTHLQSPDLLEFESEVPAKVLLLYLRDWNPDALRERAGEDWTKIESATAELHQLVVARVVKDRLEIGVTLSQDVVPIKTIQPAPDRRLVAFVTQDEEFLSSDSVGRLYVVPIEPSPQPRLVATDTGESIDWSLDSRSLLYLRESGSDPNVGRYGCLVRLAVVDASGTHVPPKDLFGRCISYLIFDKSDRLASLRDDRVVFEGMRVELPGDLGYTIATFSGEGTSMEHPARGLNQLFVLRRQPDDKYPMIDRFPVTSLIPEHVIEQEAGVTFFDLSPDRKRIVYGTRIGKIRVLAVDDGRTEPLSPRLDGESRVVWSGPDAFTFVRKIGTRNEFILYRDGIETILSRHWPRELLLP